MKFNINNFKCFYNADVILNNLTVLAGANGYGKSSVIQALLFLRRTIERCSKLKGDRYSENLNSSIEVELNGSYCLSLGMSNDVIPIESDTESLLQLKFENDSSSFGVKYKLSDDNNSLFLQLVESKLLGDIANLSIFKKNFFYLNAERIGPRISQQMKFHRYPNVGWQGEYTAHILAEYGYKNEFNTHVEVDSLRLFSCENSSKYLLSQTQEWMEFILPGTVVDVEKATRMQSAQILVKNQYSKGMPILSTNIGFGISYVLPIIVTGLIAPKGSIIIIENPEAHLHPSAQSKIGHFLSVVAQSGVTVIVETHSEHVINGIQIAVAKKIINNNLITINFFSKEEKESKYSQPSIKAININQDAMLSCWPTGFFDQTQKDYSMLYNLILND